MSTACRVIVADDEPLARKRMRSLLAQHADLEIVAECATGPEVIDAVQAHRPDVLFLDVQMPGLTGVDVLERLGSRAVPAVVFVTAFDEHAIRAFEHHALDYLLKPVDDARFERTLSRVRERLAERRASLLSDQLLRALQTRESAAPAAQPAPASYLTRIVLKSVGKINFVEVAEIDWIEAEGDYLKLHTPRGDHLLRSTMTVLEGQLDPREFVRIHRSTIVRLSRIKELQPYFRGEYIVILHDGTRLKLSRSYRDQLQAALGEAL